MDWTTFIAVSERAGLAVIAVIHDYQTLIAGLLAIGAAYITAYPVWRQLDRISVQTGTMFREFLADRIRALVAHRKWLAAQIGPFRQEVEQRLYEMREFEDGLNIHWIFERAQIAGSLKGSLKKYQREQRDAEAIATCLRKTLENLDILEATLDEIHYPHSSDQSGEDYSFTDEQWAEVRRAGEAADERLDGEVASFTKAANALDEALASELSALRDRLRHADDALLKN